MDDKSGFQQQQPSTQSLEKLPFTNTKAEVKVNRDLIEMALRKSPSGGNSRPFHWSWTEETLNVIHDVKHAEHYLNRNQHASWIALGCLIESAEVAARAQGLTSQVEATDELGAIITFVSAPNLPWAQTSTEMIEGLRERITFRGGFRPSAKPDLDTNVSGTVKVRVAGNQELTPAFKKYMPKTENYLWLQSKATEAFFKEVRFFDHRKEERGIRSKDLGVSIVDQAILWLLSFVPWMLSVIVRIPVFNMSFKKAAKRNLKNAHYVLVTAEVLDPMSLLQVGKEAMSAWLQLQGQGYRLQPCSTATLSLVDSETGHLPEDTLGSFRKLFAVTGPQVLKEQFRLGPQEKPVWIFRVGKP